MVFQLRESSHHVSVTAIRSYFSNCTTVSSSSCVFPMLCAHWYRDTSAGLLAVLPCRGLLPSRRSPLKNLWEKPQAFLLKALISQTPFKPWAAKHFVYCVYGPLTLLMLLVFSLKATACQAQTQKMSSLEQ